jgi:hypothetical protein
MSLVIALSIVPIFLFARHLHDQWIVKRYASLYAETRSEAHVRLQREARLKKWFKGR